MTAPLDDIGRQYTLERAPPLPPEIVSLMFQGERDALYSIAKHYYRGYGDIIDAGIFMGASTFCFGKGLQANHRYTGKFHIHAYDQAIVFPGMANDPQIRSRLGDTGSDFSGYLKQVVAPFGDMVNLHIGDITGMSYEGKIEVLFLDVLKNVRIMLHCNRMFMGRLMPGVSLLIQQDYYWSEDWYINAYMELLSNYFTIVDSAETTCIFLNTQGIPEKYYKEDPFKSLTQVEIVDLLDRSRDRASTLFQHVMSEFCTISYAIETKTVLLAQSRLRDFEARFGKLVYEWRFRPSLRRAWHAYTAISRRTADLAAA